MLYKGTIDLPSKSLSPSVAVSLESLDALKDATQLGIIHGEQRKTKELLCWARRKQRRHIRTEEVYDYLIGRPPYRFASRPYHSTSSTLTSAEIGSTNSGTTLTSNTHARRLDSTSELTTNPNQPVVDDLQTFRQALVMHGKSVASNLQRL